METHNQQFGQKRFIWGLRMVVYSYFALIVLELNCKYNRSTVVIIAKTQCNQTKGIH